MGNELMLKAMAQLANAIGVLNYHLQAQDDSNAIAGHLHEFEKLTAELRSIPQIENDVQPQLNKADCSTLLPPDFLPVLIENHQAQIAGYYNDDTTDEQRRVRNAVIVEYGDLISIYKTMLGRQ